MTISFAEYTEKAATTAIFPPEQGPTYTALGLCSEVGELMGAYLDGDRDRMRDEIGDVLWYTAMVARTHEVEVEILTGSPGGGLRIGTLLTTLAEGSGQIAGVAKKKIRDGHDSGVPDPLLESDIWDILECLGDLAYHLDTDLPAVAQQNLDKLADRARRGKLSGSGDNR